MLRQPLNNILLFAFACLLMTPALSADLQVGSSVARITPPHGVPMAGYYHIRLNEGTHDELFARSLVLSDGTSRAAIVSCDLISMPREIATRARDLILKRTGIPSDHVMVSATHTHTGPVMTPEGLSRARGRAMELGMDYLRRLPELIADSVEEANNQLHSMDVYSSVVEEPTVSFNRRFLMKDGTVGWNAGKLNPNIVRPAGPIDPELGTVFFQQKDASPDAVFVNFPIHLDTVGGLQFSADFPYTLIQSLEKVWGSDMTALFTMGTSGNINHIDVSSGAPQKGHEEAARIGAILASGVLKAFEVRHPVPATPVQAARTMVPLSLAPVDPSEAEVARQVVSRYGEPGAAPFLDFVQAFKLLDVLDRDTDTLKAEVQIITLGREVAWVGLPGEIFVELGLQIKQYSPFPNTIVTTLANDSIGYVPDRKGYAQGNYEAVSSRVAPGSGEQLVDAATTLLIEAYRPLIKYTGPDDETR